MKASCRNNSFTALISVALLTAAAVCQAQTLPVTSGLRLWFKADDGVTSSGGFVSSWADQSGNAYHASQSTSGQQPLLVFDTHVGRPMIRFDGVNDYLQSTATLANVISASSYTIFAAFKATAITDNSGPPYDQDTIVGDHAGFMSLVVRGNGATIPYTAQLYNWDGNADVATNNISLGAIQVFSGRHDSGNLYAKVTGGIESSAPSGNTAILTGLMRLGAGWNLPGNTVWFNGDIGEVLLYNRVLTSAERSNVESYLEGRWIPEPSSLTLLGLGGLLFWRRRAR